MGRHAAAEVLVTGTLAQVHRWTPIQSFPIRFGFVYALDYVIMRSYPLPLMWTHIPQLRSQLVLWFATQLLGASTADAYREMNFYSIAFTTVLSFVVALVWLAIDRARRHEEQIHDVMRVLARYGAATCMIAYGMGKVFPELQVNGRLQPVYWITPLSQIDGGQIVWLWLEYSPTYQFFVGVVEVLAGALLLFRRTVTIGALLTIACMANVVMLLAAFDKRVWGATTPGDPLILSVFLLLPHLRRLWSYFLMGKPIEPEPQTFPWRSAWVHHMGRALKVASIAWISYEHIYSSYPRFIDVAKRSRLSGAYKVEEFTLNGSTRLPQGREGDRWLYVGYNDDCFFFTVQKLDGTTARFVENNVPSWEGLRHAECERRTAGDGTLVLRRMRNLAPGEKATLIPLTYRRLSADEVVLAGTIEGDSIHARIRKIPDEGFPLYNPAWRDAR